MAAIIGNRDISLGVMGGTLITAACYGGGDVFGCSPYDAATTRYLKATYPSYWAAIRDYGFANPQLVPWINEDNDLIVSLVGVGKVRKLISDGNAYIDTNLSASTPRLCFDCLADMANLTSYPHTLFGVIDSYSGGTGMYGIIYHGTGGIGFRVGLYSSNYVSAGVTSTANNVHLEGLVTDSTLELKVNGVSQGTKTKGSPYNKSIYLFRANCSSPGNRPFRIARLRLYADGVDLRDFVPMIHEGQYGMLDAANATFYANAGSGSFTIELTDTPS